MLTPLDRLISNDRIIELAIAAVTQARKDASAGCTAAAEWLSQQQRDLAAGTDNAAADREDCTMGQRPAAPVAAAPRPA